MSNEEAPPFSQTNVEPTPLHLPSNLPPRAGVTDCMIIPSRSLISKIFTATDEEARLDNNDDDDEIRDIANTSTDDLPIL
jgi:hypothetical protein